MQEEGSRCRFTKAQIYLESKKQQNTQHKTKNQTKKTTGGKAEHCFGKMTNILVQLGTGSDFQICCLDLK